METVMCNKKVKIVCVGIGGYASVYMKALFGSDADNFEIVGAVDPYPEGSAYLAEIKAAGIPIYSDMEGFYAERSADLAIITTPIHFHTRQIMYALEQGSNVLCEKPLSGVSADAELIETRAAELGKFVMIGYQWSYAKAILALKADVLSGALGAPVSLKTLILWPRDKDYFNRGSRWAGKLRASDGTVINDSVAANACAHYIHNMLYVCGEDKLAAEPTNVKADLVRVNEIENFDNATISFSLPNGAKCLFVAAHSANVNVNPAFEYRFERATVKYDEKTKDIVAYFNDGTEKHYGNPFEGPSDGYKSKIAIEGCLTEGFRPVCTPYTAAAHTRCIEAVQTYPIYDAAPELIKTQIKPNGTPLFYIEGLAEAMKKCYNDEIMLSETELWGKLVK